MIAATVCLAMLGRVRVGQAACARPRTILTPEAGADLPLRPILYLFTPKETNGSREDEALVVTLSGQLVGIRRTPVGESRAFHVDRLEITGAVRAGPLTITLGAGTGRSREYSYQMVSDWRAPPKPPEVTIVDDRYERNAWTCSHTTAAMLTPSVVAPAYRVEWATSAADYRAGRRQTLIFPRNDYMFSGPLTSSGRLGLGYLSCVGETFPVLDTPVYIGVTALFPDGTEVPASAVPWETTIDRGELASPPKQADAEQARGAEETRARGAAPASRHYGAALVVIGVLLSVLLGWGWRRRAGARGGTGS